MTVLHFVRRDERGKRDEFLDLVSAWHSRTVRNPYCPACFERQWEIGNQNELNKILVFTCTDCGYIQMFSADKIHLSKK